MCISHYRLSCPCIMFAQPNTSSRTFLSFLPSSFPLHDASAAPLQPSAALRPYSRACRLAHANPAGDGQILLGMTAGRNGSRQEILRGPASSGRAERRRAARQLAERCATQ